jgi:hypothetical protein
LFLMLYKIRNISFHSSLLRFYLIDFSASSSFYHRRGSSGIGGHFNIYKLFWPTYGLMTYISMCCIFHQLVTLSLWLDNNHRKLLRVHRWRWHVTKLIRDLICLKYYMDKYFSDFSYVCFFLKKIYSIRKLINLNVSSLVFKFNLYIKNIFN